MNKQFLTEGKELKFLPLFVILGFLVTGCNIPLLRASPHSVITHLPDIERVGGRNPVPRTNSLLPRSVCKYSPKLSVVKN